MKEWARDISFFWCSFSPNTTISILSFQKSFFKSTITSPFLCNHDYILLYVFSSFLQVFHHTHTWICRCFFLGLFWQLSFCSGKQPGALQRGHQLLFDALVTRFTAETLVVCSEHREPARFDHQQYLDDSHGKGLSMAQSVGTLDRGWIFERKTTHGKMEILKRRILCLVKIIQKQHQWFFIPAPSKEGGV